MNKTLSKVLKSVGFTIVVNAADICCLLKAHKADGQTVDVKELMELSIYGSIFNTTPAIATALADNYIFQNITNNKLIQYGATIISAPIIQVSMLCILNVATNAGNLQEFFQKVALPSLGMIPTILQAMGLKYIWADEDTIANNINTNEFDTSYGQDELTRTDSTTDTIHQG